ncbi:hypothetical protein MM213_03110 [Belliella sp. R4-6]|uniref:Tetratricopeptide repeat-containing protein n=1 Tax=Belliella alkalica TaxID=1730871 RepID=A0ABS9V7R1_9BACT|nr:hypothetical protein [Belliella alkalica]MCH7412460.1 hypothetical protein [Belliella alkalica]
MSIHEELIIKYFEGNLSDSEREVFEDLLESDPLFKEEVVFQQKTKLAFQNNQRKVLKGFLNKIENDIQESEKSTAKPKSRRLWSIMAVAAALISILAVTYFVKTSTSQSDDEISQNFYAFYEPYPNVVKPITRGEIVNPEELEIAAFIAYESSDFKQADSLFAELKNQQKEYILFYRGITKIELEQYDSANMLFESYLYSEGMQFRDQAKWYMALSYLVKGDSIKGKEELVKLRKSSGYKMEEVERLLLKLD